MRVISSTGSSVGFDHGMPVSDRYQGPFPFEGALHAVDIQLVSATRHLESDVGEAEGRSAMGRQ